MDPMKKKVKSKHSYKESFSSDEDADPGTSSSSWDKSKRQSFIRPKAVWVASCSNSRHHRSAPYSRYLCGGTVAWLPQSNRSVEDEGPPPDLVPSQVLLFFSPPAALTHKSFLSVFLLPKKLKLFLQMLRTKMMFENESLITLLTSCELRPNQTYTLSTYPQDDSVLVHPTVARFDAECDCVRHTHPCFQVSLNTVMETIKLILTDTSSCLPVWEMNMCLQSNEEEMSREPHALNLPVNERLENIQRCFAEAVPEPAVNSLLDKLLETQMINDSDRMMVDELPNTGDRVRFIINTVMKNGDTLEMMDCFRELDSFLCKHLSLNEATRSEVVEFFSDISVGAHGSVMEDLLPMLQREFSPYVFVTQTKFIPAQCRFSISPCSHSGFSPPNISDLSPPFDSITSTSDDPPLLETNILKSDVPVGKNEPVQSETQQGFKLKQETVSPVISRTAFPCIIKPSMGSLRMNRALTGCNPVMQRDKKRLIQTNSIPGTSNSQWYRRSLARRLDYDYSDFLLGCASSYDSWRRVRHVPDPLHLKARVTDAFACLSVQPDPESEGDTVGSVEASVSAVNYTVTNTMPAHSDLQDASTDPPMTRKTSRTLLCSRSMTSLTQSCAQNGTFMRSKSLPSMRLNSSFEEFTPDITDEEEEDTYRFRCCRPGLYQCTVTGLAFRMKGGGDVLYKTIPWNRILLVQHHRKPAGPLFDITCLQQSVCQLHLPHCEVRSTGGCRFLSVAHVKDEAVEFIRPHEITETHVVINITGFSGFGNVKDEDSPPDPVQALVLLFYRPPAEPETESQINVLLLPKNISLRDVQCTRKKVVGDERYIETSPHCKLVPDQAYTLSTCPQDDSVEVQPTDAEFDKESYDNYFPSFQVELEKPMKHLKLILRDTSSFLTVWERRVCLSSTGKKKSCGANTSSLPPNERLLDVRGSFVDAISEPVLKSLLDKLLEKKVINDSEREVANSERTRGDKAHFVVDTVRKKGDAASSEMMECFHELDPFLCEHLGLI